MAKIEANEVLAAIDKHKQNNHNIPATTAEAKVFSDGYDLALDHIKEIVTIMNIGAEAIDSIKPQGEWLWLCDTPNAKYKWSCNKCGRGVKEQENYCPNCGIKMSGGTEE